jgi:hypothetical protein
VDFIGLLTVADANYIEWEAIPVVAVESRQAGVGGEPEVPLVCFDHVEHQTAGQTVPGREVGEAMAVEERDSLDRAKPEIPFEIPVNPGHPIPNQAIVGGEDAERRLLATERVNCQREKYKGLKRLSHLRAKAKAA